MIEKWIKIKYDKCPNCLNNKKSFITYFVHVFEDDMENIGDYWCTLKDCNCNGKLCGNYVRICSKCKYSIDVSDSQIEMFD